MKKAANSGSQTIKRREPPALTPEAREDQLIALAVNLAEKQLLEGTASSQVITHYLKLGSTKERLERRILEKQAELIDAKTENLKSSKNIEELYDKAMQALRGYQTGEYVEEDEGGFDEY